MGNKAAMLLAVPGCSATLPFFKDDGSGSETAEREEAKAAALMELGSKRARTRLLLRRGREKT